MQSEFVSHCYLADLYVVNWCTKTVAHLATASVIHTWAFSCLFLIACLYNLCNFLASNSVNFETNIHRFLQKERNNISQHSGPWYNKSHKVMVCMQWTVKVHIKLSSIARGHTSTVTVVSGLFCSLSWATFHVAAKFLYFQSHPKIYVVPY